MTYYGDEAFPALSDEQWARMQAYQATSSQCASGAWRKPTSMSARRGCAGLQGGEEDGFGGDDAGDGRGRRRLEG